MTTTKRTTCVDCNAVAPEEDTRYTLIGHGWRAARRETPNGIAVDWRCIACWREFKATRKMTSSGAFMAATPVSSSKGRTGSEP
jgi:hypothetical protein